ncbi:MAG: hypothetical protein AVDCRST_MAG18-3908 [uncultured Thermomicrobiales bacterium]|uniref:Uncharacterized protein n=1 Tax=uncultured Thermomicrobiales bacterium TaxID=1645740 RepID=A0A6J4VVS0_9BACT|nr:MAG: hypothetical protein AVDCRST_MAG18-3908 [uncultured Thermomicrobiales bacterium]
MLLLHGDGAGYPVSPLAPECRGARDHPPNLDPTGNRTPRCSHTAIVRRRSSGALRRRVVLDYTDISGGARMTT